MVGEISTKDVLAAADHLIGTKAELDHCIILFYQAIIDMLKLLNRNCVNLRDFQFYT